MKTIEQKIDLLPWSIIPIDKNEIWYWRQSLMIWKMREIYYIQYGRLYLTTWDTFEEAVDEMLDYLKDNKYI